VRLLHENLIDPLLAQLEACNFACYFVFYVAMPSFKGFTSLCLAAIFLSGSAIRAQERQPAASILSGAEIKAFLNDSAKKEFKLVFPIAQVYKYTDKSGTFLCVLMESYDSIGLTDGKTDTFSRNIKAVDLRLEGSTLTKVWELNDHIIRSAENEYAIWFWKTYISFEDYDGDGLIDPFLVYGTWGDDGYENGRVKFIIYLKGKKFAMRHQSSTFDEVRSTEFDAGYDALPKKLLDAINARISRSQKENRAYFYPLP
jgi:hypothetical protein